MFVLKALPVFFCASEDRRLTRGPEGSEFGLQSSTGFFKGLSFPIDSSLFVFTLSQSNFGRLEGGSSCTNEALIPSSSIRKFLKRGNFYNPILKEFLGDEKASTSFAEFSFQGLQSSPAQIKDGLISQVFTTLMPFSPANRKSNTRKDKLDEEIGQQMSLSDNNNY